LKEKDLPDINLNTSFCRSRIVAISENGISVTADSVLDYPVPFRLTQWGSFDRFDSSYTVTEKA
jgi:hypothetical protein